MKRDTEKLNHGFKIKELTNREGDKHSNLIAQITISGHFDKQVEFTMMLS